MYKSLTNYHLQVTDKLCHLQATDKLYHLQVTDKLYHIQVTDKLYHLQLYPVYLTTGINKTNNFSGDGH